MLRPEGWPPPLRCQFSVWAVVGTGFANSWSWGECKSWRQILFWTVWDNLSSHLSMKNAAGSILGVHSAGLDFLVSVTFHDVASSPKLPRDLRPMEF